ncbi:MAG: hypothetical protein UR80_C0016G0005 [Parcubacteria group bacterium GW2011_GWB1_35_5]|nr:MAG: hypothetical protein UR50_C0004G0046 [Parcubacteria group bacterium GW2011_GWC1_34_10]KKP80866.1 MAG: hypothetical protein UR80_C0016G0005 [Parcubacteria group bacterium GW2011_GWB1_35_5]OHA87443.1 MAG: hypothetical protein A2726_00845 [Candidatus Zambryskibacteria bacterium RIFCSPHIGHO2_01_FULL_35_32]
MRYFNKSFFKFTLGFLIIIAISLFIIYATSAYAAGVEKIVFTTDPQSIKPNTLSGPMTIQAQDSGGNSFQTPETIDLEFTSSSPSGEFLGSTGNPATSYMSKNTANRTFYYRDSSEGNFTIIINARGRETLQEWSVTQQIIISSDASQNLPEDDSSGEVLGISSDQSTSSNSSSGDSTTNVSSLNSQLEIMAGNDRTTSPGSPIWFQATMKKNTTKANPNLNWSFGDGNVGVGPLVSHTYKYAGDYVVVLSAKVGEIFSVSRFKVKVINSDIEVLDKGQYLEILNKSNTEINLFNWKIENGGKGFVFQPNTIILPNSSVKFDKSLLKLKGYDNSMGLSLKNYLGEEVFSVPDVKETNLGEISLQMEDIQKQAYSLVNKAIAANLVVENSPIPKEVSLSFSGEVKDDFIESAEPILEVLSSSTENIIYEVPKKEGVFVRLTKFIKRVFSN